MKHLCWLCAIIFGMFGFPLDVSAAIVTEQITFAVNEDYAEANPDWKKGAQEMIDAANHVLSLNTDKRYAIASYRTFAVRDWNRLAGKSEFFHRNLDFGGTTIFDWVETPSNPIKPEPSFTKLVNVASRTTIGGLEYGIVYLVESHPQFSLLRGNTQDYFQGNLQGFMHEFGHTMGLGVPEWYFLEVNDRTGISPDLGSYNFRDANKYDPMSAGSDGPFRFVDMNAAIINMNLTGSMSKCNTSGPWAFCATMRRYANANVPSPHRGRT